MKSGYKLHLLSVIVFLLLGISNILIKIVSFRKLIRLISNSETESHTVLDPKVLSRIGALRQVIFSVSGHTPWRSDCFEQALTASFLLKMLRISHTISFGLNNNDNALKAHAWLKVNDIFVTGFSVNMVFTAVSIFYYTSKKDRVRYV